MAGAGMRDIKRRIKSVTSTGQITKAMELVASSKLRKARERMETYRPYFTAVSGVVSEILGTNSNISSEYVEGSREIKKTLYIVIAGDKGLCGGFNTNTFKMHAAIEAEKDTESIVIPVGLKSVDYFTKRNYNIYKSYQGIGETVTYSECKELSDEVIDLYRKGEIDEVYVIYTQFVSMISQQTTSARVLPISKADFDANMEKLTEDSESVVGEGEPEWVEAVIFTPDQEDFFNLFVPQYVESMIYGGMVESYVSEQGSRRTAMENASDNAKEMIDQLTLFYNRARQAAITQEITEIVSGADALD